MNTTQSTKPIKARSFDLDEEEKTLTIYGKKVYGRQATPKQREYLQVLGAHIEQGANRRWSLNISLVDASFAIDKAKQGYDVTIYCN